MFYLTERYKLSKKQSLQRGPSLAAPCPPAAEAPAVRGKTSAQEPGHKPCFHWAGHRASQAAICRKPRSAQLCSQQPQPPSKCGIRRRHSVVESDPWPGVTRAQGCAWACWLISPWLLQEGHLLRRPPGRGEKPGSQNK